MRRVIIVFVLLLTVGILAVAASFSVWRATSVVSDVTVIIEPHRGTHAILTQLAEANALPPAWTIALPMLLDGRIHQLKAGEYAFTAGMTPAQVIDKIARGQVVIHKLTIPEGLNMLQVKKIFMDEPLLTGDVPVLAEGSLFPDTILFQRGQSRASIVETMQKRMREVLANAWAARAPNLPLKTPDDALVMASMVEKETGVADERAMVAGVFYHRLALGMKLQSDPTVAYGIELAQGAPLGRALTSADLHADTPFNSYTRFGLPPTPICNPGLAAIEAALHPAATDALYFVATGYGGHHFAADLRTHNDNVSRYRHRTDAK